MPCTATRFELEQTRAERASQAARQLAYETARIAAEQKRQAEELARLKREKEEAEERERQAAIQRRLQALVAVLTASGFEVGDVKDLGNGKTYLEGSKR